MWETCYNCLLASAALPASRGAGLQDCLLEQLQRHRCCLWVYISVPELHFSICSSQGQLLNLPDASSKWVERWQKKLLWFKRVRGQCYSVCLIIYLPSYTQHLLSLEWFKHIITSCLALLSCWFAATVQSEICLGLCRAEDVISFYWALMCLPHVFSSFPFIMQKALRTVLDAFGLGRIGSDSIKSLPPMSSRDKWVWGQVLSKACCVLEHAVCGNANSISLCSEILGEVLTKTSIDFSMSSNRLMVFLQTPALLWMHSHIQTLEVMYVRTEVRFWVSGNPEVSTQSEFCIITVKPIYFSPSQVQLHSHTWYLLLLSCIFCHL